MPAKFDEPPWLGNLQWSWQKRGHDQAMITAIYVSKVTMINHDSQHDHGIITMFAIFSRLTNRVSIEYCRLFDGMHCTPYGTLYALGVNYAFKQPGQQNCININPESCRVFFYNQTKSSNFTIASIQHLHDNLSLFLKLPICWETTNFTECVL